MVTTRLANADDLPALLEIYNDIIINTTAVWHEAPHTMAMRQEWFDLKKEQGFPVFVAELDNKVVGFSTIATFRPWIGFRFTVENSVYVDKDCRGRGIANALMPPLIAASKALGLHVIVAGIESENAASIALHSKFGFKEVAHFKEVGFKFDRWLDLTFMELFV